MRLYDKGCMCACLSSVHTSIPIYISKLVIEHACTDILDTSSDKPHENSTHNKSMKKCKYTSRNHLHWFVNYLLMAQTVAATAAATTTTFALAAWMIAYSNNRVLIGQHRTLYSFVLMYWSSISHMSFLKSHHSQYAQYSWVVWKYSMQ